MTSSRKSELVLGDEQLQFAGLGEVGLGGEQRQAGQAVVAVARHGGGGDGQQRAAEAIAAWHGSSRRRRSR